MKYCPYCGAELINREGTFCTECGKALPVATEDKASEGTSKKHLNGKRRSEKRNRRAKKGVRSKDKITKDSGFEKEQSRVRGKTKEDKRKKAQKSDRPERVSQESVEKKDDGYDGYYDDILPADEGRFNESIDKDLVKNIVILVGAVLLIVLFCVMGMYLL